MKRVRFIVLAVAALVAYGQLSPSKASAGEVVGKALSERAAAMKELNIQ